MSYFQIKIWHLLLFIAIIGGAISLVGQLGFEKGIVTVNEFSISNNKEDPARCELRVKYHFELPTSVAGLSGEILLPNVRLAMVREIESGQRIEFFFREKGYLGQKVESPTIGFGRQLFLKPATENEREELTQIQSYFEWIENLLQEQEQE